MAQSIRIAAKLLFSRPQVAVIASATVLLTGIAYAVFFTSKSNAADPIVVTAQRGDVEDTVRALGSLQPFTSVDVGAQVSGQLKNIAVKIGDNVQQGQLLAEIDPAVAAAKVDADEAELQSLRAQLTEKQSKLSLAKVQAERQGRLMADMATSQDAFDSAQAALLSAKAQVNSLQAQIDESRSSLRADRVDLAYTKIVAPMSGTISAVAAKKGETLNAKRTTPAILTIADLSTMTVYVQVAEADVPKLRVGMTASFTTLGNPNKRHTGTLRQILPTPTVANNVVLYTALFDVPNSTGELMPLMSAQVSIVRAAAHDVLTVPVTALQFRSATRDENRAGDTDDATNVPVRSATVTVLKEDGSREKRDVMVAVSDRVRAAIVSGLSEGEKVLTDERAVARTRAAQQQEFGGGGFGPGTGAGGGAFR